MSSLKGPARFLPLQITMKNQDKKNGPAKHSTPKSSPGQREAGAEGTQGRHRQTAPAAEAEGSTSQTPVKPEGVCLLRSNSGQREEFEGLASLLRPVFTQEGGTIPILCDSQVPTLSPGMEPWEHALTGLN